VYAVYKVLVKAFLRSFKKYVHFFLHQIGLKGLFHEMDWAWSVLGPNRERSQFLNFFGAPMLL
jgi:hypothetical protein